MGVWLSFPAGAMVGAFVAVGAWQLGSDAVPAQLRAARQFGLSLLGALVGIGLTREVLPLVTQLLPVVVASVIVMLAIGLGLAYVLAHSGRAGFATAIFALAPGGLAEMTSAAESAGGDAGVVAAVHLFRIVVIVLSVPVVASLAGSLW